MPIESVSPGFIIQTPDISQSQASPSQAIEVEIPPSMVDQLKKNWELSDEDLSKFNNLLIISLLFYLNSIDPNEADPDRAFTIASGQTLLQNTFAVLSLVSLPSQLKRVIKERSIEKAFDLIAPWILSLISPKYVFSKAAIAGLCAARGISKFITTDLTIALWHFRNQKALGGMLSLGQGLVRTACLMSPFYNVLSSTAKQPTQLVIKETESPLPQTNQTQSVNDCEVTFYATRIHSSVGLSCPIENIQKTVGFYPREGGSIADEAPGVEGSWKDAFITETYTTVKTSSEKVLEIADYIDNYREKCPNEKSVEDCAYKVLGNNCIDFAQSIYRMLGEKGHYFSRLKLPASGIAPVYVKAQEFMRQHSIGFNLKDSMPLFLHNFFK